MKDRGVGAIEYGVMVLLVAFAFLGALGAVGRAVNAMFELVAAAF